MRRRHSSGISHISRKRLAIATGVALAAALALTAPVAADQGQDSSAAAAHGTGQVEVEYFAGPGGHPRHTQVPASAPLTTKERSTIKGDGDVLPIVEAGASDTKVDVVFIGDGYTAAQQEDFHADVRTKWKEMAAVEPYAEYEDLFNVWAVDAHSQDSGVSGDPTSDVRRNTALDSAFFCDGIERLLCVDTNKVEAYASKAADPDLVIVLGNSTKYGGAGYNAITSPSGYDGIGTASSDHPDSDQVAVHETGHSFGKLADEYWYDESTYSGPEPGESNLTKLSAEEMAAQKTKWHQWLGQESPDGGTVGAYEGGGYHGHGLNRPTEDSIMRTLGREFNLPGREAMIAGFHQHAPVLSGVTPTDRQVRGSERIRVEASSHARVRWFVDGREAPQARDASSVTPAALGVPADGRAHTVTARATDPSKSVRAPEQRKHLTGSLSWQVTR
ncbi:M64 family metallopeptidase [Streptomyces durmitorensis]|uniref:M64 family metallopeptidase n=1 Tax=Streptomyces durmitorensis TaxID=319947 RepID=A0ABY4PKN0_9ACTN|nr:M64 family metallopeptidase [Streptomyces durmitorensis]UQT54256.1 M64 family metallopeptidase [Streptomyces durmitorensis]